MLGKINSAALRGIDGYIVSVEVDVSQGLPLLILLACQIMLLRSLRKECVQLLKIPGFEFPVKKITVNLAPANT